MPRAMKRKAMDDPAMVSNFSTFKLSNISKDFHKAALLQSTLIRYRKKIRIEEEAEQMFVNDLPLQVTSQDGTAGRGDPEPAEVFKEGGKEPPSISDEGETGVSEAGDTSSFPEQPAGQGAHEDPGCGPSSPDLQDILNRMEDLQINPGKAPEHCLENGPIASSSENPTPTFQWETSLCDCSSPVETPNNPSPGNLEALVAQYLSDLSLDDYYDDTAPWSSRPSLLRSQEMRRPRRCSQSKRRLRICCMSRLKMEVE